MSIPPTRADPLSPLLNPHAESGFHCVYRHGDRWRARVLDTRDRSKWRNPKHDCVLDTHGPSSTILGVFDGACAAARAVAAWYLAQYGDRWPEAFAQRRKRPWRVRYSARLKGYLIDVWVRGVMRGLTDRDCGGRTARFTWPDRAAARAALRRFIERRKPVGMLPRVWLWRAHQAPRPAAIVATFAHVSGDPTT